MSYQDQAELLGDGVFTQRVAVCTVEQAQVFINDERPEYQGFARHVITSGSAGPMPVNVVARPGMTADSSDADIVAAVQYCWPLVGAGYVAGSP